MKSEPRYRCLTQWLIPRSFKCELPSFSITTSLSEKQQFGIKRFSRIPQNFFETSGRLSRQRDAARRPVFRLIKRENLFSNIKLVATNRNQLTFSHSGLQWTCPRCWTTGSEKIPAARAPRSVGRGETLATSTGVIWATEVSEPTPPSDFNHVAVFRFSVTGPQSRPTSLPAHPSALC